MITRFPQFLFVALLAFATRGHAAHDVVVAPDGKADAPGTRAAPTTLAAVCARRDLPPGTTVLMRGGRYPMEKALTIAWRGEPTARITLCSAPGEWAVLDGALMITGGARWPGP